MVILDWEKKLGIEIFWGELFCVGQIRNSNLEAGGGG